MSCARGWADGGDLFILPVADADQCIALTDKSNKKLAPKVKSFRRRAGSISAGDLLCADGDVPGSREGTVDASRAPRPSAAVAEQQRERLDHNPLPEIIHLSGSSTTQIDLSNVTDGGGRSGVVTSERGGILSKPADGGANITFTEQRTSRLAQNATTRTIEESDASALAAEHGLSLSTPILVSAPLDHSPANLDDRRPPKRRRVTGTAYSQEEGGSQSLATQATTDQPINPLGASIESNSPSVQAIEPYTAPEDIAVRDLLTAQEPTTAPDIFISNEAEDALLTGPQTASSRPTVARSTKARPRTRTRPSVTTEELPDGSIGTGVARKSRRSGRPRRKESTPEEAQSREIAPDNVRMVELCVDNKVGKRSNIENAMRQVDWTEVVRKRKEAKHRAAQSRTQNDDEVESRLAKASETQQTESGAGPQLRIVNGQMVIDQSSLVSDRRGDAVRHEDSLEQVEEDDLTQRINSHSWIQDNRRDPQERGMPMRSDRWTVDQTDAFYDALRMFGTDFYIISRMFPGKTRRHIKLKFVREERAEPERVKAALIGERVPMNLEVYGAATGQELDSFKDPKVLAAELDAEDERHQEEVQKKRAEYEEVMRQKVASGASGDPNLPDAGKAAGARQGKNAGKGKSRQRAEV